MEMPQENSVEDIDRVQLLKDEFERVKTGEVTYGKTLREDILQTLEKAGEDGEEMQYADGKNLEEMANMLPVLEVRNVAKQVEGYIEQGDLMTAKSKHAEAEELLHLYEGEVMSKYGFDTLSLDLQDLGDKLYTTDSE